MTKDYLIMNWEVTVTGAKAQVNCEFSHSQDKTLHGSNGYGGMNLYEATMKYLKEAKNLEEKEGLSLKGREVQVATRPTSGKNHELTSLQLESLVDTLSRERPDIKFVNGGYFFPG